MRSSSKESRLAGLRTISTANRKAIGTAVNTDSMDGYKKIEFSKIENGKEWLLKLKVVNGQLIAEMYDKK